MATKTTPLVGEAVGLYLESRYDLGPASIRAYGNILRRFSRYCPVKQVGRLTASDFEGFIQAARTADPKAGGFKPCNDTSLRHMIQCLKQFLDYCHRKGWCRGDLMSNVRRPGLAARRDYIYLSPDELLTALGLCTDPRDRIALACAMNTGLRSNEMKLLRLRHFDLTAGYVFAAIPKGRVSDNMPISLDFDNEIRRWLGYYESECGPLDGEWFMLPTRTRPQMNGYCKIVPGSLNPNKPFHDAASIASKALLSLGYAPERIAYEGMHTFRRSVARIYFDAACAEAGYDGALRETMALLHHKNSQTTELYLGITSETEKRNLRLKGKPFLSALTSDNAQVRRIANG